MTDSNNLQKLQLELSKHASSMRGLHMRDLFMHNPNRAEAFSIELPDIFIDYSKNIITSEILESLFHYAELLDIKSSINSMFSGEKINITEKRAVLHTALRSKREEKLDVDGADIIELVHNELDKIKTFTSAIHSGEYCGWTNKSINTFVNIGIGGSNSGPKLVIDALSDYRKKNTYCFFISNIDYRQLNELKKNIDPETTLFIVSSKSFSTLETKANAESVKEWLVDVGCDQIEKHFVAITENEKAAIDFGISQSNIFHIWDWVGGRFSLWSAIGLVISLALGFDNFQRLLNGAREMDLHFKQGPNQSNAPVILALLDYWYNNFLDADTHAFIPYDESLKLFPDYLAQLFMESNGKSADLAGNSIDYKTMPVTWGGIGTDSQHAFFQLLHQGTQTIPVDFLAPLKKSGDKNHHRHLLANCIAQSQALLQGEDNPDPHKHFPGNKPSTTILYKELSPEILGKLLALYEHRTFVLGLLWKINSFDQWGVELGKKLAANIYENLKDNKTNTDIDSSTKILINKYLDSNK